MVVEIIHNNRGVAHTDKDTDRLRAYVSQGFRPEDAVFTDYVGGISRALQFARGRGRGGPAEALPMTLRLAYPARELPFLCLVGAGAASFWRGAWYTMDALLFPDNVHASCAASLFLGFGGFAALHQGVPHTPLGAPAWSGRCAPRAFALYTACLANVAAWRGVWMAWDIATGVATAAEAPAAAAAPATMQEQADERRRLLLSGLTSHASATALLLGIAHLTSALAPPARACILSDRASWGYQRASRYLEDVGQLLRNAPKNG